MYIIVMNFAGHEFRATPVSQEIDPHFKILLQGPYFLGHLVFLGTIFYK